MNYFKKWSLNNPTQITSTKSAKVFKVQRDDESLVLKVYTELGKKAEGRGALALRIFNSKASVSVIEYDEGAVLMEFIEGEFLKEQEEEKRNDIFLEVFKSLHKDQGSHKAEFDSMERRYRSLLERGSREAFFKEGSLLAEKLLMKQSVNNLLHGDLHHKNILYSKRRGWLAIDPQPLMGDPLFDLGNFFYNPDDEPKLTEDPNSIRKRLHTFSEGLEVEPIEILEFAIVHGYLSSSWQLDEGQDPARRLRILEKLKRLS